MRLILTRPTMPTRNLRNRNYCFTFVVFQIFFVAVQVFIFYPCWQKAPDSTILRVFRSNQQQSHQIQPDPQLNKGPIEKTRDAIYNGVNQGVNYVKDNAPVGVQPQGQDMQQPQPQQWQQQQQQQQQQGQIGNLGARENGQNFQDVAKEKVNDALNYVQNKMGLNQQVPQPPNGNNNQAVQQQQLQQQQQQQQQQAKQQEEEGAKLRGQQQKMLEHEQQKAVQQNQLASQIIYNTSWASLDSRPNPQWYDSAKIGIFIHWGVYAVPSFSIDKGLAEWFWFYWKSDEFVRPQDPYNAKRFEAFLAKHYSAIKGVKAYAEKNFPPTWRYTDFAPDFKAEMFDPKHWAKVFQESGAK